MNKHGCDVDALIQIRQDFHKYPEGHFKEFKTQGKLMAALKSYGIEDVKKCATTGLIADIHGTGAPDKEGLKCVAIRADIDGLFMPENNHDLPYRTVTEYAHCCGHDGHMAMLLAAAQVIQKQASKIPKGKRVRLLFQPAEESPGGALPMIKEGCLDGVEEVYGLHNIPNFDEGDIRVCEGGFFAGIACVSIKCVGLGGHGSSPHKIIDPITCANQIFQALHTIKSRNIDNRENFVFTICHFKAGSVLNVFPNEALMEGTIRFYKDDVFEKVKARIDTIASNIAEAMMCKVEVKINDLYPPTINHPKETAHIKRLAEKWFGPEHVSDADLPSMASEDFSYFIQQRPGCFFALGTLKPGHAPRTLHHSDYNFNDDMIATGGYFWTRLVEDRLNVKLID